MTDRSEIYGEENSAEEFARLRAEKDAELDVMTKARAIQAEQDANPAYIVDFSKPLTLAVFLAESPWGEIDEQAMGKGLGGRETALVHLVMEWAAAGHDVYAFVPRSTTEILDHDSGGKVRWIPNKYTIELTEAVQPDVFISWENVAVLKEINEKFGGITAIEMQVAHLSSDVPVDEVADYVCVLSDWAGRFIREKHPTMPEFRCPVFANGVDLSRFENLTAEKDEESFSFIYSSSPDRGLHHLLKMWKEISDQFPSQPTLHICYGIESFVSNSRWSHREDGRRALDIEALINQPGIVYHGKVGQDKLAELIKSSDLMLYPADTMSPTETGCISIVEALAAGTPVITTDCDCIGEDYKDVTIQVPLPLDYNQYVEAIMKTLEDQTLYDTLVVAGQDFVPARDWSYIALQWTNYFKVALYKMQWSGAFHEALEERQAEQDANPKITITYPNA